MRSIIKHAFDVNDVLDLLVLSVALFVNAAHSHPDLAILGMLARVHLCFPEDPAENSLLWVWFFLSLGNLSVFPSYTIIKRDLNPIYWDAKVLGADCIAPQFNERSRSVDSDQFALFGMSDS